MQFSRSVQTPARRRFGPRAAALSLLPALPLLLACATVSPESLRAEATEAGGVFLGTVLDAEGAGSVRAAGFTALIGYCVDLQSGMPVTAGPDRLRALFSVGAPYAESASAQQIRSAARLSGGAVILGGELRGVGSEAHIRFVLASDRRTATSNWFALPAMHISDFCQAADTFVRPAIADARPGAGTVPASDSGQVSRETGADQVRISDVIELWGQAAVLEGEGKTGPAGVVYQSAARGAPKFAHFSLEYFRLRRFEFPDRYRRLLQNERREIDSEVRRIRALAKTPGAARLAARALISAARDTASLRPELCLEFTTLAGRLAPSETARAGSVALVGHLYRRPADSPAFDESAADRLHGIERAEYLLAGAVALFRARAETVRLEMLTERIARLLGGVPSYHNLCLRALRAAVHPREDSFRELAGVLERRGLAQTRLHATVASEAALLGDSDGAALLELRVRARMLGLEEDRLHAALLYAIAQSQVRAGDKKAASANFRSAEQIFRKHGFGTEAAQARAHSTARILGQPMLPLPVQVQRPFGFTPDTEMVMRSYTGLFDFSSHHPDVKARTYGGRHTDTNVFLRALLDSKLEPTGALGILRRAILPGEANERGRGVVFVDIGPAVANRWNPAVTAASVARDFPEMPVVALDLPDEIGRFHKLVPAGLKRKLFAMQNFRIVSADGVQSLKTQFAVKSNWIPEERAILSIPTEQLVVVRAANSVDIYVPYDPVRASLEQMPPDFADHSLLYFFNRSILWKPRGTRSFRIVGFVSVRGFHHNKVTFSREGDPAFTLSLSAVNNALKAGRD